MNSTQKRFLIFLSVLLLLLLYGCGSGPTGSTRTPVILITLDTLRSDHLPDYGYSKDQTPALSAFRKDAVLYEMAFSHTPLTLPSHATIMTGLLPENHGVRDNTGFVLNDKYLTLAERLSAEGYQTGAVVSSMVLRTITGMAQGFDFFEDQLERKSDNMVRNFAQRRGDASVALARKWLGEQPGEKPVLMWLHLYDPHTPWTPPSPFAATYDGEIAYTDSLMQNFFDFLKEKGLYDKSLIMVMSDHGEGLGDHGEEEHGILLYRESVQVPLLIKYPDNQLAGASVDKTVGLVDIMATVETVLGLDPTPGDGLPISHAPDIPGSRALYIESLHPEIQYGWHAQKSAVRKELHLIKGAGDELFDMLKDPEEKNNLYGTQRIPKEMVDLVERDATGVASTGEITAEDRAMLESLGYTGSFNFGDSVKSLTFEQLDHFKNQISAGQKLLNEEKYEQVEADMLELVKVYPDMHGAKTLLAMALTYQKKFEQAEHVLMEAMVVAPQDHALLTSLTSVKIDQGKWDEAFQVAKKAMDLEPDHGGPVFLPRFFKEGKLREAHELAAIGVAKQTNYNYAYYVMGRTSMMKGDLPAALTNLEKAAAMFGPDEAGLLIPTLVFLAECQEAANQGQKSLASLERALELDPEIVQTYGLLGEAYLKNNRVGDAEKVLEAGLAKDASVAALLHAMARVRLRQGKKAEAWQFTEKALKADPVESATVLSFAWLAMGAPADVEKMAKTSLRLEKKQPHGHYLLGRLAHAKKDYQNAKKHFEEALKYIEAVPDPNVYAELAFYLGDTEASMGDPTRARMYFEKAVELKPFSPQYQLTLATLYARVGDGDGAKKIVADWLAKFPSKANFEQAARAMTGLGFEQEAATYRQRAAGQ